MGRKQKIFSCVCYHLFDFLCLTFWKCADFRVLQIKVAPCSCYVQNSTVPLQIFFFFFFERCIYFIGICKNSGILAPSSSFLLRRLSCGTLAKAREMQPRDLNGVKCIKDEDQRVLVKEGQIKDRRKSISIKFLIEVIPFFLTGALMELMFILSKVILFVNSLLTCHF